MTLSSNQSRSNKRRLYSSTRTNIGNFYDEVTYKTFTRSGSKVQGLRIAKKDQTRLALNFDLTNPSNQVFGNNDKVSICFLTLTVKQFNPNFQGGTVMIGLTEASTGGTTQIDWSRNSTPILEVESRNIQRLFKNQYLNFDITDLIRRSQDLGYSHASLVIRFKSENQSSDDFIEFYDTTLRKLETSGKTEEFTQKIVSDFTASLEKQSGYYRLIPTSKVDEVSNIFTRTLDGTGVSLDIEPFNFQKNTISPDQNVQIFSSLGGFGISGGIPKLENGIYPVTVKSMTTEIKDPSLTISDGNSIRSNGLFYIDYEGVSGPNYGVGIYRYSKENDGTNTKFYFPDSVTLGTETKYDPGDRFHIRDASTVPRLAIFKRVRR